MKKRYVLLYVAMIALFVSCKKDDKPATPAYTCATCATAPAALPANDASSKGIYKGVILASTGTITFDISNAGNTITAVMVLDGITTTLTSSVTWVAGQPYIADFTGTLNGSPVTIQFSVGLSGASPTVTSSSIPGHPNATLLVVKETSTSLVECFEGTYSTTLPETGTFNIILSRNLAIWGGISRETGTTDTNDIDGVILNNQLLEGGTNTVIGTLANDQLTGSFVDSNGSTVTVTGRRTL